MKERSEERDEAQATKVSAKEMRDRDAELAMKEYQDERLAMAEKTARLRALRLAKEASERAASAKKTGKSKRK
jgi:hypothetical protein